MSEGKNISQALGLMYSMICSGEVHSPTSIDMYDQAVKELEELGKNYVWQVAANTKYTKRIEKLEETLLGVLNALTIADVDKIDDAHRIMMVCLEAREILEEEL